MTVYEALEKFEKILKYSFHDKKLLKLAMTHKSYAHEKKYFDSDSYNERIEFLGDAILEHIISDYLYRDKLKLNEGEMTKKRAEIVCEKALSDVFREIKGDKFILLGKCELVTGGREKDAILADAFEALIGAIYLDSDYYNVKDIVLFMMKNHIDNVLGGKNDSLDYKTMLQEVLQKKGAVHIHYEMVEENGPDHEKNFVVDVYLEDKKIGRGSGKSKKIAEQKAAEEAYAAMY